MNIELVVGAFAGALVLVVTGMLTAGWKVWIDRERLHVEEIKRLTDERVFSARLSADIAEANLARLKQDLVDSRLYNATLEADNATLERENDSWRAISGGLRDQNSMLKVILKVNHIDIPDDRRNVTKPLDSMLVEHLENRSKPRKEKE